jgi:hypothetical protein
MAVLASDDFNRADSPTLSGVGTPWIRAQSVDNTFQIISNQCAPQIANADSSCVYATVTWPDDQYSQATISNGGGGGVGTGPGLIVRGTTGLPAGGTFYRLICDTTAGGARVSKVVVGVTTHLGSDIAGAWANGDVAKFEAIGTLLSVYRNGVLVGTKTDSAITSGAAGLFYGETVTTPRWDNWSAGSIDVGVPAQVPMVHHPVFAGAVG